MTNTAFPDALPALSRLHWYVIERVLGQGGFGITYLARDTNLDQRVAIKEYLPVEFATRLPDTTVRSRTEELRDRYRWGLDRFIQEARTLARFDHPSIVRVHSVFEFNNTAYMVMRFEDGINLAAMLDRRGTLAESDLLRILLPVLGGLELVHSAGFIHRDIKPDNVHIADDGRAVLLDFGSARQALGNAHTLTILVAPGYAPFEQYYSDSGNQGPWTDIYALGATCYRAIAGRAPLDAVSRSKGILGSTQDVLVPASVIGAGRYSGGLLAAIDHALAFAEKDRPQSIAEWRQELAGERTATPTTSGGGMNSSTPPTTIATHATMQSAAATTVLAATSRTELPPAAPSPSGKQPVRGLSGASARRLVTGIVVGAAILALGVLAYVLATGREDETRTKLAALEKQVRTKELADAERERAAKDKGEDEARQRREQEQQAQAAQEKSRTELAAKRETAERPRAIDKKQPAEMAKKSPPAEQVVPLAVPQTTAPNSRVEPAGIQPPVAQTPSGAAREPAVAVAEPAKSTPRTHAEQFADADRAMTAKRYAEALAILRPLAEAGYARAQALLGDAYAEGHGISREEAAAGIWYEKAALQGETGAQFKLAAMYAKGNGVVRNNNLAYVWYGTAARLGSGPAKPEQDKIAALLQPAEREQADRLIESSVARMAKKP